MPAPRIAVVIPCYRVTAHIDDVLARIGPEVELIYCVDDACPDKSGEHVRTRSKDRRVKVVTHAQNQGVGGAVVTGYKEAIKDGAEVVLKIDGDGQMPPELVPLFVAPIARGQADYTKGNRFFHPADVRTMPRMRLFGNAVLSFFAKLSSGYWDIFDPTNGYTAVHARLLENLPLDKLHKRYFFESDLLFRLSTVRAVVHDVPMSAHYADEKSNLRIGGIIPTFLAGHAKNTLKRLFYNYLLRNFSVATLELVIGLPLFLFGLIFGAVTWTLHERANIPATAGTVMLAALPVIVGAQLVLGFLHHDIEHVPRTAIHPRLPPKS